MSFLLGGTSASNHATTYFDIRLEGEPFVCFRGSESESGSAYLKGNLVLCLNEPLTTKHIRLHLNGISRVSYHLSSTNHVGGIRRTFKERTFYEQTWTFRDPGKGKTECLKPGNYEFPFNVVLDPSLPESVEGLQETWVVYRFKAEIGRKYAKDIVIRKPLRIIRTLSPANLELSHAMAVENIWPNKIEYSISTPTKAIIFGTSVRVDFRLVSLLKGLKIGLISTEIIESHDFILDPDTPATYVHVHKANKAIASDEYVIDEETEPEVLDEEAEGYQFSRHLELPKSLKQCLQDTDARGLKVRHKLKFNIQLHNPDGHTSELRATLPIALFISPALAINENHELVDQSPSAPNQTTDLLLQQSAPPMYGAHQYDQLYSEIDLSGYVTPAHFSAPGTPGLGHRSRHHSNENLASVTTSTEEGENDVSAAALASRLQNLRQNSIPRGDYFQSLNNPGNESSGHSSGSLSRNNSVSVSRRTSQEDQPASGTHTPVAHSHEVEDLTKVPSYSTALRSSARTPLSDDLPTYASAMSRSSSQNARFRDSAASGPSSSPRHAITSRLSSMAITT